MKMKILITHPDFSIPGGVAGYLKNLDHKFKSDTDYFSIGKRSDEKGVIKRTYRMICDYRKFLKILKKKKYDIIHLNPSLDFQSIIRDGIFLLLGKIHNKKVIVFFHGWMESVELAIDRWFILIFKTLFNSADAFIVLADKFKDKLKFWGFNQQIYIESTCIDDKYLKDFDIKKEIIKRQNSDTWKVLFLSRITREKGIYETIEAISFLNKKYPKIELFVAGDGNELEKVKTFVDNRKISNIIFTGYVSGKDKYRLFKEAKLYCFPTFHGEGMPVAIVEAMAFGLPIITRPVGKIYDFFVNYEHGFCTESSKFEVFAEHIERLITDKHLFQNISFNNYRYAQSHFLSSKAVFRLEKIYRSVLLN